MPHDATPLPQPTPIDHFWRWAALLLLLGLCLRVFFVVRFPFIAGDSLLYQDIALNWLHAHVYGLSTDAAPRPTLIRLPGYPSILAACASVFDRWLHGDPGSWRSFQPVVWLQVFADLVTCCVVAQIARRMFDDRTGLIALALACLCPFTANYTAVPLTETFTLLCLALALLGLQRWSVSGARSTLIATGAALACGILLRPDQGLLAAVVVVSICFARRVETWSRLRSALLCAAVVVLPLVPWTLRNEHTFHVLQPLAPRMANDPGEAVPLGFQRWFRTWAIDFSATQDAYWNYPEAPVRMNDLPARAFDSQTEREQVAALLTASASDPRLNPAVEHAFAMLAQQRIAGHGARYYVLLPAARLLNMLFHPRTEMLPVAEHWWDFRAHRAQTLFALWFAALNAAYFGAAALGFRRALRADRVLTLAMCGYLALRCALLLTVDNPEQRYTLEFFPILCILGAASYRKRFDAIQNCCRM